MHWREDDDDEEEEENPTSPWAESAYAQPRKQPREYGQLRREGSMFVQHFASFREHAAAADEEEDTPLRDTLLLHCASPTSPDM
jgi:hypothetical protein